MAHVLKVKAGGVGPVVGHYAREAERRGYERGNIDNARTPLNYAIGADSPDDLARRVRATVEAAKDVHVRNAGKALRKDANVLCDWVVTLPGDCPEGLRERFFEAVVGFIQERYGRENVPGGFVHMDEATPHVHVPVVPLNGGRLQASRVVDRADLKTFHGQLGAAVDGALGMHVSIELSDEASLNRALYNSDDLKQFKRAKDAARAEIDAEVAEVQGRLEGLRQEESALAVEVAELEPIAECLSESLQGIKNRRKSRSRERVLGEEIAGLRERISGLERRVGEQRARLGEVQGLVEKARGLLSSLVLEGLRAVSERAVWAAGWLGWYGAGCQDGLGEREAGEAAGADLEPVLWLDCDDAAHVGCGRGM